MPSFDRPADPDIAPSPWVMRFAALLPAGGTVLDVACGHGRHARWLAGRGHRVIAADVDCSGVADLRDDPRAQVVELDLEVGHWPWEPGSVAGIIVTNYLHRPHFPHLITTLAEGGALIFETFAAGNERLGRPRNPAFLLRPGELLEAFGESLQVVAYEHGVEQRPRPAVRQRLCALRSGSPAPLDPG